MSCSSWRSLSCAASTAKVFWRAVMAASRGLRRASSSAWRNSALACSNSYAASSALASLSAWAWTTCCSASARSASASLSLNSCSVVSNCATTSPSFTRSPELRSLVRIKWRRPSWAPVNISEFPPCNSPLAETVNVTSPRFTAVVGTSEPVRTTDSGFVTAVSRPRRSSASGARHDDGQDHGLPRHCLRSLFLAVSDRPERPWRRRRFL